MFGDGQRKIATILGKFGCPQCLSKLTCIYLTVSLLKQTLDQSFNLCFQLSEIDRVLRWIDDLKLKLDFGFLYFFLEWIDWIHQYISILVLKIKYYDMLILTTTFMRFEWQSHKKIKIVNKIAKMRLNECCFCFIAKIISTTRRG